MPHPYQHVYKCRDCLERVCLEADPAAIESKLSEADRLLNAATHHTAIHGCKHPDMKKVDGPGMAGVA